MDKIKKYILPLLNIIVSLILGAILLFTNLSDKTVYIMLMSLVIGWAIPYFVLLVTGIVLLSNTNHKLALIINIINIILCIFMLFLVINIYDKDLIIFIIDYIIIGIISIINVIYYIKYIKNDKVRKNNKLKIKKEKQEIKKIKKENNGAIV